MSTSSDVLKKCSQCAIKKSLNEFGFDKKTYDGHRAMCRPCHSHRVSLVPITLEKCTSSIFSAAKRNSNLKKRRKKAFTLEGKHVVLDLYKKQDGLCYYSKLPMSLYGTWKMSLERIDSSRGYHIDNIVLCCLEFNTPTHWSHERIQFMINLIDSGNIQRKPHETFERAKPIKATRDEIEKNKENKEDNDKEIKKGQWHNRNQIIDGIKHYYCSTCQVFKPIGCMVSGKTHLCKPCANAKSRAFFNNTVQGAIRKLYKNSKNSTKTRAKAQNPYRDPPPDNINELFLQKLYNDQGGLCAISGMPLETNKESPWKMSLDRIDTFRGYMKDNVRLICRLFQAMDNSVRMLKKINKRKESMEKKKKEEEENTDEEETEEEEEDDEEDEEDEETEAAEEEEDDCILGWTREKFLIFKESYTRNFM